MKIVVTGFVNTMPKPQRIAGLIYIPFHIIIIPLLLSMLTVYLPSGLDEISAKIIYYGIGFAFCMICMWKYLRNAYDVLLDNVFKNIVVLIFAYIFFFLLSYFFSGVLFSILGDELINPNNDAVMDLASESPRAVIGLSVLIAPIVEEILFRGVLFGSMATKYRKLAYILSISLFAFYHVWQYALVTMDWQTLIYMIQYIPAGYALAWLYEKTNCIWLPIFLHMAINVFQ